MKKTICAIASPLERPYIEEWIDHHRQTGFDEFVIGLHGWRDFEKVDYGEDVHLLNIHSDAVAFQVPFYERFLQHSIDNGSDDWIAFIDIDEFIVPTDISLGLDEVLMLHSNCNTLAVNWRLFGSNGKETYEDIPVRERFTRCSATLNHHLKQIVNARLLRRNGVRNARFFTPHALKNLSWEHVFNFRNGSGPFCNDNLGRIQPLEIHHYITKSKEECRERRSAPRSDTGLPREEGWLNFFTQHDANEVEWKELVGRININGRTKPH